MSETALAGVLDSPTALAAGDPEDMLAAVAGAGAQLRGPITGLAGSALSGWARPRVVVVAGMGGSAAAGDVLAAVMAGSSEAPVVVHRGYGLPAWVGQRDLVAAISCSGRTEETLSAVAEAGRRGIPLLTVGAAGSPLAAGAAAGGGVHVDVDAQGRQPRACLWSLAAPLLVAADRLGLVRVDATIIAAAAEKLDAVGRGCHPQVDAAQNPAKSLALWLVGGLPMVWGFSEVAAVAAARFVCQVAENAKFPAVAGAMSEPQHNQIVAFDGPLGRGPAHATDMGSESVGDLRIRPLLLCERGADPGLVRRAVETVRLAEESGLTARQIFSEGDHPLVRLAGLTALLDFTSVYLALAMGIDPTPVPAIVTLKERLAASA
jgi:glucose/mannose-6-phosphate isomerase